MNENVRPTQDRLLIRVLPQEETTPGGIVIPDMEEKMPQRLLRADVVASGPGYVTPKGAFVENQLKAGQRVLFRAYEADTVINRRALPKEIEGGDLCIIQERDVMAVLESS